MWSEGPDEGYRACGLQTCVRHLGPGPLYGPIFFCVSAQAATFSLWRPLKHAQRLSKIVIPATAGVQTCQRYARRPIRKRKLYQRLPGFIGRANHRLGWIPAFAGMTRLGPDRIFAVVSFARKDVPDSPSLINQFNDYFMPWPSPSFSAQLSSPPPSAWPPPPEPPSRLACRSRTRRR